MIVYSKLISVCTQTVTKLYYFILVINYFLIEFYDVFYQIDLVKYKIIVLRFFFLILQIREITFPINLK